MGRGLFMQASRIKMIPSAGFSTSSPSGETTSDAKGKNVEVGRNDSPAGMPESLELIRIAGSETRRQILRLLQKGFDHPEDLAKKLKIRRTSVDKQLVDGGPTDLQFLREVLRMVEPFLEQPKDLTACFRPRNTDELQRFRHPGRRVVSAYFNVLPLRIGRRLPGGR